jgi:hypothetical protein
VRMTIIWTFKFRIITIGLNFWIKYNLLKVNFSIGHTFNPILCFLSEIFTTKKDFPLFLIIFEVFLIKSQTCHKIGTYNEL